MVKNKTFTFVGGDLRQTHMANMLAARDCEYRIYGMFLDGDVKLSTKIHKSDDIRMVFLQSDILVFPLPLLDAKGNINAPLYSGAVSFEECLAHIQPHTIVLAGKVSAACRETAREKGIEIYDYLEREEFSVLNAVPTAEGAIEIAMRELPTTLFGSTCMVVGYGRIGKILARLLRAFGARVKVVARKHSDLAWTQINGCEAVPLHALGSELGNVDVVFNTVPVMLLDESKLKTLKRDCLIVDLASKPGGVDFDAAKDLGLKTEWALSLPGKVAPVSAGEIALATIFNIINERGCV